MKKGTVIPWILLYGVCLFALGFFAHMLMVERTPPLDTGYLEHLTQALSLSPDQEKGIRNLLEEADRRIDALKEGKEAKAFFERIQRIRAETSEAIRKMLDEEQRRRYDGLEPVPGRDGSSGK